MQRQKRALAIHDISCVGRCSLTVALPILSAAGVDTAVLPTSVLSTHTGGFQGFTFRDLTEDVQPIEEHWKSLGLQFDSIYTGFLGSLEQIELMCGLMDAFGEGALKLVDPVMADNGQLYAIFGEDFPGHMRALCAKADIILPNFTEAALLLGEPYCPPPYDRAYVEGLLDRLTGIGAPQVALTGVDFGDGKLGAAALDTATGDISYAFAEKVEGYFHGTGDIFGSAFLGALLREKPMGEALQIASDYTRRAIVLSEELGQEHRYGVAFELALPEYIERLQA